MTAKKASDGDRGLAFSLYKDQLGGWMLRYFDTQSGDEDHRACSSEARARRFAREEWDVKRWTRETRYRFTAFIADEEGAS